jgi:hypothetical protein
VNKKPVTISFAYAAMIGASDFIGYWRDDKNMCYRLKK